jgi:hypothetical protein
MSGLREALENLCDRYDRIAEQLSIQSGVKATYDIPGSEIRSLLAAHPAEPAPVASREALEKVIDQAGSLKVGGTLWPLDRENVREIADALLAAGVFTEPETPVVSRERVGLVLAEAICDPKWSLLDLADALLAAGVFRDEATVKAEAAAEALHMAADELDAAARGWKTPALKDIPEDWDAHHLTVRNASEIALTNAARAIRRAAKAGEPS